MPFSNRNIRIGLQTKAVIILTFMVLGVALAGGWLYLHLVRTWAVQSETVQAERLATGLTLSASGPLALSDREGLSQLARDLLAVDHVLFVAFVDKNGQEIASASRGADGRSAWPLIPEAATVSYIRPGRAQTLLVARPVLATSADGEGQLVGGVRLAFDSQRVLSRIQQAQSTMMVLACLLVLGAVPVGYLLVWRVLLLPLRRLMEATHRLAGGDFAARAAVAGHDEIAYLAESFNTMAGQIEMQRTQLIEANEQLEEKVQIRTAELDRANHRLSAEMAEKDDFLRAVSHDLNAPLRNIGGMATMIQMKFGPQLPEDVITRLGRIQVNVEAQTELIQELLELSRIRSRPQRREWTDMGELMTQIGAGFEYDLKQRTIELTVAEGMPRLYVERSRMRQVFQNLIDNAIKYMGDRDDGRIDIRHRLHEGEHVFSVADNGPGIAPEDQQRIFCVFRRAASASTTRVPGKGVGLASVKTIVSNYDGRVWVESQPGAGSTFHVALAQRRTEPAENECHDSHRDSTARSADHCLTGR